jgi:hypothetical protein
MPDERFVRGIPVDHAPDERLVDGVAVDLGDDRPRSPREEFAQLVDIRRVRVDVLGPDREELGEQLRRQEAGRFRRDRRATPDRKRRIE